jgi:hypothetical protein
MRIARLLAALSLISLAACATTSLPGAELRHEARERRDARR